MANAFSTVTQSKYYSPSLNAAIFDGAVRIYFTQYQEAAALKIYFRFQEMIKALGTELEAFRRSPHTLYIMLYPTGEIFESACAEAKMSLTATADLDEDFVIGIRGPLTDEACEELFGRLPSYVTRMERAQRKVAPRVLQSAEI